MQRLWRELHSNPSCKLCMAVYFCMVQVFSDRKANGDIVHRKCKLFLPTIQLGGRVLVSFQPEEMKCLCIFRKPRPNQFWAAPVLIDYRLRNCKLSTLDISWFYASGMFFQMRHDRPLRNLGRDCCYKVANLQLPVTLVCRVKWRRRTRFSLMTQLYS